MIQFYKDLKDNVKDDFYKENIPDILIEYIHRTIKINDHLYIHRIERYNQGLPTLRWTPRR